VIERARQAYAQRPRVEVWPQHWHAWQLFLALGTQWRVVALPSGRLRYIGLDYAAAERLFREKRPRTVPRQRRREVMRQLRELEAKGLAAANE
jgi:hypothetical protein